MDLGMIGLGKMGANMAERLVLGGHRVVGFDLDAAAVTDAAARGVEAATSIADLAARLPTRRVLWIMVPAGDPVDRVIAALLPALESGDVIVDGGNSNYRDTMRRGAALAAEGIALVDIGTSGGIWGLTEGYSMMVGGDPAAVALLRPALETLAPTPDTGWGHTGAAGSGHFVKMVHNGIEYGLMQAYAEGFAVLRAKTDFELDLAAISRIWQHGSVVRSWLLDLTAEALAADPDLGSLAPHVEDSGEGRWTVLEAIDLDVAAPVIALSLMRRLSSRDDYGYADRLVSALRNQFGGHAVTPDD